MGRLRNLSQSFKAVAFPSSYDSNPGHPGEFSNSQTIVVDKLSPAQSPDPSATTFADASRPYQRTDRAASRPMSMVYTAPLMDMGRDNHIEELLPVFRSAKALLYTRF